MYRLGWAAGVVYEIPGKNGLHPAEGSSGESVLDSPEPEIQSDPEILLGYRSATPSPEHLFAGEYPTESVQLLLESGAVYLLYLGSKRPFFLSGVNPASSGHPEYSLIIQS